MEKYFKKGQSVTCIANGEGMVIKDNDSKMYPIKVDFGKCTETYTYDGRMRSDLGVCLYQTTPIITPNVPIIEFEKDELVWCSDDTNYWFATFYSHQDVLNGNHLVFMNQQKSGNSRYYKHIRKFNDNPLLSNDKDTKTNVH